MTLDEFDQTRFGFVDKALYDGKEYPIATVDFKERLLGLTMNIEGSDDPDEITWVRCENAEIIHP